MTQRWTNPAEGYGPGREEPAQNARGWSADVPSIAINPDQQLLPFPSGGIPVMQHTSNAAGILQLQFLGDDNEFPPRLPAVEVEIRQGVNTGAVVWRVYVGRVGVAVPVSAGLILGNVVRTRGPRGVLAAQLRHGIASDMAITRYERVLMLGPPLVIPLPLGTSRWECEVGPGATVSINTGKSLTVVAGPTTASGIVANDAMFTVTAPLGDSDALFRFLGNC
jgi:hypothetical protein